MQVSSYPLIPSLSNPPKFPRPFTNPCAAPRSSFSFFNLSPGSSNFTPHRLSPLRSTATQEIVEVTESELQFVEIGYVSGVHGLQGEVRIKANTDFPELRFAEPGRRWLRQVHLGKETIQEVELLEGRGHTGKKNWIVKFGNVDKVEQAKQLVGSTLLVTEEDRPHLDEGEFYTRDLVGMTVILKETGQLVGTVVNVFNTGASDLLHVMLNSSMDKTGGTGNPKSVTRSSAPLVWVPFVEAIVPHVDMNRREMLITPPKGLLELNVRFDDRSKKESRQLEWKERKKFQKHLIAAKKKLCEMEQQHVFLGYKHGDKAQWSLLSDQIVGVNSKLLQIALKSVKIPSERWNLSEFITSSVSRTMRSTHNISEDCNTVSGRGGKPYTSSKFVENGKLLTTGGKVATVLIVNGINKQENLLTHSEQIRGTPCSLVEALLSDVEIFLKVEDRQCLPLILVCPADVVSPLQDLFFDNNHFAFNPEKVIFLEEEKLPVVSSSLGENEKHKILMKSPWEILEAPVGSGGIISLFSSNNVIDTLGNMGVEYIEILSVDQGYTGGKTLLGLVDSCGASIGIKIFKGSENPEENIHVIFSLSIMQRLMKRVDELHFQFNVMSNPHVEMIEKGWVDAMPSVPNSLEFFCSIYESLRICPLEKVCVMEVVV